MATVADLIFLGSKITADGNCSDEIKSHFHLGRKATTNLNHILKQRYHFANKGPYSQSSGFSISHVRMWVLDHKEDWVPNNWCFSTVVLKKDSWESLDVKSWLIRKVPDAGKDWRQEEKETTEEQMVGWHHWLSGQEFEQALEDGDGQGSLACCSPWVAKSRTWLSNWTTTNQTYQ